MNREYDWRGYADDPHYVADKETELAVESSIVPGPSAASFDAGRVAAVCSTLIVETGEVSAAKGY